MRNNVRLLAFAVTAILALTASPAMAADTQSGGGCRTRSGNGWEIAVCSSDNGVNMYPDYWVDARPIYTGVCQVVSYVYWSGSPGPKAGPIVHPCTADYGSMYPYPMSDIPVGMYHRVFVTINGTTVFDGSGPKTYCC